MWRGIRARVRCGCRRGVLFLLDCTRSTIRRQFLRRLLLTTFATETEPGKSNNTCQSHDPANHSACNCASIGIRERLSRRSGWTQARR